MPYGTHSFRCGGCQYFSSTLGWPIRTLLDWGGWAMSFNNTVIVRYLMSWNDDPVKPREDFMKPTHLKKVKCGSCQQFVF
jgi:hypothetical protein